MLQALTTKAYTFELLDVPVPEAGDNQVLLEMKRVGICGSDIQVYHGKHKYMTFPIVLGHEISAVVMQAGKNVTNVKVGERVTIQPQIFCGECYPCQIGSYNVCQNLKVIGIHTTGACSDYFAVDASKVVKLPDDMDFDIGALVEPVAVGVHAAKKVGQIKGANVVVLGAGAIGNFTAQAAKALGAANVMITDVQDKRLELAKKGNVDYCVNTMKTGLADAIKENFGARGADAIIDCAAVKASIQQAIKSARRASKIIIVGNFKEPVEIEIPMLQRQEIDLISVMMYVREDYEDAVRLLGEGKINTEGIITNHFDLKQVKEAYEYIDEHMNDIMKVMLKVNE
ncbi:alcohol dehydrogenase catalytic domain-containing protein [Petroclostridium sp. X23]|uniref:zinc-dependent alcohol dehydrogenase n=1 Tax=Petroclostridium sp. X23 TaxID=3045146 RepID=UPI0024AD0892|nr:alcohol dehydrogenase catalytic domain-containing protein [Petroclostridium sp. X23]WHH59099.1 alcohol dehydrogenase catalytic domain-containing protein [Petroclostridium sp. X23]